MISAMNTMLWIIWGLLMATNSVCWPEILLAGVFPLSRQALSWHLQVELARLSSTTHFKDCRWAKLHITSTIHTWLGSGTRNEVCYNSWYLGITWYASKSLSGSFSVFIILGIDNFAGELPFGFFLVGLLRQVWQLYQFWNFMLIVSFSCCGGQPFIMAKAFHANCILLNGVLWRHNIFGQKESLTRT